MVQTEPTTEILVQRLDRLERENRRLKRVGFLVAIGIAAAVLMGQARTAGRVVEAEKFLLRDPSGKPRAQLAVRADGTSGLALYARDGKPRAGLTVGADGSASPRLNDRDEKNRAVLGVAADGRAAMGLFDRDGKLIWGKR